MSHNSENSENNLTSEWQCCFCGEPVENQPPDPCQMVLTFNYPRSPRMLQRVACHVECFKRSAHPSMVFVPFD